MYKILKIGDTLRSDEQTKTNNICLKSFIFYRNPKRYCAQESFGR